MRISIITQAILVLTISTAFICLSHASCSGSCSISSGGTSYDFLGDPSFDPNMDTLNDFVSNNLGQPSLSVQSISPEAQSTNSSLNQTNNGNVSLNSTTAYNVTANPGKGTSNNTTVKLGGLATQDVKQSTIASMIFENNNNMF